MPIYQAKDRAGKPIRNKHRVTVYVAGRQHEWTVDGTKAEARTFEASKRLELTQYTEDEVRAYRAARRSES